jgi:chemotaxis protein CheC
MTGIVFAEAQRDAMSEMVNIGMGQAGDSLARLFDTFIRLSVPRIQLVEPGNLPHALAELCGADTLVIGARQAFSSSIRGEAVALYTEAGCEALTELVRFPGASRDEILLDITNALVGACAGGIAAQFSLDLALSAPSLLGQGMSAARLLAAESMEWGCALLAEVSFRVEDHTFQCHLLTFWPDASLEVLVRAVDQLLATV